MANLKDLIVNGAARIIGKTYSSEFVGNVTGDVTGDLTGNVTGSVFGNADTATKLKTARSLKITDDGTNTSTGVDFDGSDAVTLKLPSTIKASITGNVSGSSGSCTGNAKTATTADKTAYSLSIKDGASTPVAAIDGWNGSATGTLTITGTSPVATTATANTITVTHDKKGPSTTAATSKGDTDNQAPGFGGTFKVTSATVDVYGHTTELTDHTVTIPSSVATVSANGLMSSADKTALDNVPSTYATKTALGDVEAKLSNYIPNAGSSMSFGDGTTVTVPASMSTNSVYSWKKSSGSRDTNIMYSSEDGALLANSGDCGFIFAVYNTDVNTNGDFSDINTAIFRVNDTGGSSYCAARYGFTAPAVWGAVFNDLADSIPLGEGDIVEPGYCYGFDGEHYVKTSEYMQQSYIGIHSDTYGFRMGYEEGKEKFDVAVSGFVLAYVDKEYPVGTPLTCTKDGYLTKISKKDKIEYPEMIIAKYWKSEPNEEWGTEDKKIKVKGRRWVKVK